MLLGPGFDGLAEMGRGGAGSLDDAPEVAEQRLLENNENGQQEDEQKRRREPQAGGIREKTRPGRAQQKDPGGRIIRGKAMESDEIFAPLFADAQIVDRADLRGGHRTDRRLEVERQFAGGRGIDGPPDGLVGVEPDQIPAGRFPGMEIDAFQPRHELIARDSPVGGQHEVLEGFEALLVQAFLPLEKEEIDQIRAQRDQHGHEQGIGESKSTRGKRPRHGLRLPGTGSRPRGRFRSSRRGRPASCAG